MLVDVLVSVAFYCPRCGKIHTEDVPYFCGKEELVLRCTSCESEIARVAVRAQGGLVLNALCACCGESAKLSFPLKKLKNLTFEKIYCQEDHFELGYIGRYTAISEFLDFNAAEYEAIYPGFTEDALVRSQVLLEAVNRVHELAERKALLCSCGGSDFTLDVADGVIVLTCKDCGRILLLPAESPDDLRRAETVFDGFFGKAAALER